MQIETSKIDQTVVLEIEGRMDVIAAMQYEKGSAKEIFVVVSR